MGQNGSTGAAAVGVEIPDIADQHRPNAPIADTERVIVWEIYIARGCLDSFNRMLGAQAIVLSLLVTVNLIGFLQPPRGWDDDHAGRMYSHSSAIRAFLFSNSLSLYTAISGLLFYIYCSHSAIVSLQSIPLPTHLTDPLSLHLLHRLRSSLRTVTLPSIKHRCAFLFSFMACSLFFSMVAYICGGIASARPRDRMIGVIIPAIPGCVLMVALLLIAADKLRLELDFERRFEKFWAIMAPGSPPPELHRLSPDAVGALDPLPSFLASFKSYLRRHRGQPTS